MADETLPVLSYKMIAVSTNPDPLKKLREVTQCIGSNRTAREPEVTHRGTCKAAQFTDLLFLFYTVVSTHLALNKFISLFSITLWEILLYPLHISAGNEHILSHHPPYHGLRGISITTPCKDLQPHPSPLLFTISMEVRGQYTLSVTHWRAIHRRLYWRAHWSTICTFIYHRLYHFQ